MKSVNPIVLLMFLLLAMTACSQKQGSVAQRGESREAKQLLQGVWLDEETEEVVFKMKGDSVYYPDSTSLPASFKVIGDTLYIGLSASYPIEKHTQHLLWFRGQDGSLVKLVKGEEKDNEEVFERNKPQILTLTEVLKSDTVVMYGGERYHLYVAVNPTKYKVVHTTLNDDGLQVENVYYDNIIHLSIFHGATQLFSRDFRKSQYARQVPEQFLSQAVLNNMEYASTDANGFHLNVSLCVPDDASCYLVEHVVSFNGQLATHLSEY